MPATIPTAPAVQTGHIGLNVSDITRSTQFYQDVFGWDLMGQSAEAGRRFAFLGAGGQLILTLWEQSTGAADHRRPGLHHLSFEVTDIAAVRSFAERLSAHAVKVRYDGIVPHAEGADSGGLFFEDPDGIRLEIFSPSGAGGQAAPTPGAPTCGFF
jgi:catechol 2,3-dioxygenase-like lactoylglutathione lyase family enzyme